MAELTELGLQKPDPRPLTPAVAPDTAVVTHSRADSLAHFLDRLLQCLSQLAPEAEPGEREQFTARLREFRATVSDRSRTTELDAVAESCLTLARRYFERSLWYHSEREKELTEVIAILREAAKLSVGDAADYHAQVLGSADRFTAIAEIENIRELRRRMGEELTALRRAVAEKQEQEARTYAQLTSRVEALQGRLAAMEEEVTIDPLTQVGNRRRFDIALSRMVSAAQQANTSLSICTVDIDHFKKVNDTHGHPIGDRVLVCVAQFLTNAIRQTDVVARYGGDEFMLLLASTTASDVEGRLRKVVTDIAASGYEYDLLGRREVVRFTVSCGLADLVPGDTEEDLLKRVDEALYEAKKRGRNRLVSRKRSIIGRVLAWG
jgi:diguanylate cyclase (GGDEF)-like protein